MIDRRLGKYRSKEHSGFKLISTLAIYIRLKENIKRVNQDCSSYDLEKIKGDG